MRLPSSTLRVSPISSRPAAYRAQVRAKLQVPELLCDTAASYGRARGAILGHSILAVTLEIYTHSDDEAQLDALTRLYDLFDETGTRTAN